MSTDNPYAPHSGSQMSATVNFGDAGTAVNDSAAEIGNDSAIKDTTTADFTRDVIQASRQQPVLVDFWAPWCGPCKQLTPVLEKVINEAGGRVQLVKLNIDDHPAIPGQMGIQSIPAVVAFVNGQPVDGFMGAQPESQIRQFIDKLAGPPAPSEAESQIAGLIEQAQSLLGAGKTDEAAQLFGAVLQANPSNAPAIGGLASCMLAAGATQEAAQLLDSIEPEARKAPEIAAALKQLEMTMEASDLGNPKELEARISTNPDDFEARLALSKILNVAGDREAATSQIFAIMQKDRNWNDEAARKQLLEFFEAWGPTDPATLKARRQLSSILFS